MRLSIFQIDEIRARYRKREVTLVQLGREYGVSKSAIHNFVSSRGVGPTRWKAFRREHNMDELGPRPQMSELAAKIMRNDFARKRGSTGQSYADMSQRLSLASGRLKSPPNSSTGHTTERGR